MWKVCILQMKLFGFEITRSQASSNEPDQPKALESPWEALQALESDFASLREEWLESRHELDATYRKVHSELGYINRGKREAKKLEGLGEDDPQTPPLPRQPFGGSAFGGRRR